MKTAVLSAALLLSACVYTETPYGRTAVLDLPVHAQTTVIYQDSEPVHNNPAYPVYPRRIYRYR